MRKIFLTALFVVIAALMVLSSGTLQAVAQQPTGTPSPTPYPAITVVIGNFTLTGIRGLNAIPNVVLTAINSLNLRTIRVVRAPAILTADAAQQAAINNNAALVIWAAPEGSETSRHLVIHYDMVGRQALLDAEPLSRRRVTLTGLYGIPESAEITAFEGIPAPALTAFTQAQLFLALADDARANDLLVAADQAATDIQPAQEADAVFVNWLHSEIAFYRAYLALRVGSFDIALDRFQEILTSDARPAINAWTNINAGAFSIQRRSFDNAVSLLEQAITQDEGAILAYINLGTAYWRQGDDSKALDTFDKALELDSQNTYALNDRGYALFQANQPDEALQNFRQVIAIDPTFIDAYINQALLFRTIGEIDLALRDINTAIKLTSQRDSYPYVLRGDIYFARGEYDLSLADLEIAIGLDPENDYALTLRGDIFAKQGNDADALDSYTLAIGVTPTNPYPYLQRSQSYLKTNKFKEAALDATSALELGKANPDAYVDAYFYRAEAYSGLNRFPEAIADYQRYVSQSADGKYIDAAKARITSLRSYIVPTATTTRTRTAVPTSTPTAAPSATSTRPAPTATSTPDSAGRVQIGDNLADQGEDNDAIAAYTAAIQQTPGDPYPYLQRAKVYLKILKYREAYLDASVALELGKADPETFVDAYFYRGEANSGLNRLAEAIADYESYVAQAPDGRFVEVAKVRITSVRALLPKPTSTRVPASATPADTATRVPATATTPPTDTATPASTSTDVPAATPTVTPTAKS